MDTIDGNDNMNDNVIISSIVESCDESRTLSLASELIDFNVSSAVNRDKLNDSYHVSPIVSPKITLSKKCDIDINVNNNNNNDDNNNVYTHNSIVKKAN